MENTDVSASENMAAAETTLKRLRETASAMSTWLKFLGIVLMISGALTVFSIVGIVFAWVPLWLGVILFQAGDRAHNLQYSNNLDDLLKMLEKLKTYFVISGVVTILSFAFTALLIFFSIAIMREYSREIEEFMLSIF